MSMNDEEIRGEVRRLLSVSSKKHGKSKNRWEGFGIVVGLFGAVLALAIVPIYMEIGFLLKCIVFLVVLVVLFGGIQTIGQKINAKRAEKLAQTFYNIFPKGTAEFDQAIALLKMANTKSGVEEVLLSALKMDVTFGPQTKKSGFLETGEFGVQMGAKKGGPGSIGKLDDAISNFDVGSIKSTMSSGPGWASVSNTKSYSSTKVPKQMFDHMIQSGKLEPIDISSEEKGVGATPSGEIIYHGNINIMSELMAGKYEAKPVPSAAAQTQDPADQLLGGFDAPAQNQDEAQDKSQNEVQGADKDFIPLDPYHDPEPK